MRYDDEPLSCVACSRGLDADELCDCDHDPMCWRDHQIHHVMRGRWAA